MDLLVGTVHLKSGTNQNAAHPIIYHQFLREREDGYIPPSEMVLRDEAMLFITAGVDTVSDALTVGTLNVLYNPAIHKRLQQELLEAWPIIDQPPRYEDLERISYLVRQQLALLYFRLFRYYSSREPLSKNLCV